MIPTLEAISARLSPLTLPVYLFTATIEADDAVPNIPYFVLAPASHGRPSGARFSGRDDRLDFPLRLTAVSGTEDAPSKMLEAAFDLLTPKYDASRFVTADRRIEISFSRTEVTSQLDMNMTLPRLNRHPSFGVATYRVVSAPLA